MRYSRTAVIRAMATILIGALLIVFPLDADRWLVMGIGALFLVPGVVTLISWLAHRKSEKAAPASESKGGATQMEAHTHAQESGKGASADKDTKTPTTSRKGARGSSNIFFPIIGIGSILFGAILLLYPDAFRSILLYILGAFLVLAGIAQVGYLNKISRCYHIGATPFVLGTLLSLAGVAIILIKWFGNTQQPTLMSNSAPTILLLPSYIFGVAGIIYGLSEIIYSIQFRHYEDKSRQQQSASATDTPATDTAQ